MASESADPIERWTAKRRVTFLKTSNKVSGNAFWWSVALAGDTLAVAALGEDSAATDGGPGR